jgi:diguanylate cyclase (GGDEF)-like protein
VLQGVAGLLAGNTRKVDTVGRWGGEEFLIICPHVDMEGIAQLAEKLRQAIAGHDFPVVGQKTASFGVCTYWPDDHANSLVARADAALYAAKHQGRNRVEVL